MREYRIMRELFMEKKHYLDGLVFWYRNGDYIWCKSPYKRIVKFLQKNHESIWPNT